MYMVICGKAATGGKGNSNKKINGNLVEVMGSLIAHRAQQSAGGCQKDLDADHVAKMQTGLGSKKLGYSRSLTVTNYKRLSCPPLGFRTEDRIRVFNISAQFKLAYDSKEESDFCERSAGKFRCIGPKWNGELQ